MTVSDWAAVLAPGIGFLVGLGASALGVWIGFWLADRLP